MAELKDLDRIITAIDDDWPEVMSNLRKSKKKWSQMYRIFGR